MHDSVVARSICDEAIQPSSLRDGPKDQTRYREILACVPRSDMPQSLDDPIEKSTGPVILRGGRAAILVTNDIYLDWRCVRVWHRKVTMPFHVTF